MKAITTAVQINRMCWECLKEHERIAFCRKCKACLYLHSKQDIEAAEMGFPMFFCTKCGTNNFWD